MSSRLTRSGAREHDRKKRSGRSGWRMLTWPNESTIPSFASTWFAVTRSSSRSSSFAISGSPPEGIGCRLRPQPRRPRHRPVVDMGQLRLLAIEPRHVDGALLTPFAQPLVAQLAVDAAGVIDLAENAGHELDTRGTQVSQLLVFLE